MIIVMLLNWKRIVKDYSFFLLGTFIGRCQIIRDINELQINEEIRDKEVRLIDSNGDQLGIVAAKEAQKLANSKNLDLVKIAPQAKPPVCKIMDYGKYKYELAKKEKEAKKNQKVVTVKEVRLSPNIEKHDLQVKVAQATKFLKNGDKVKVTLRFRGRELSNVSMGRKVIDDFKDLLTEISLVEKEAKLEGKQMIMVLTPKNS
ncbi:translation initiation factor IF-3 [Clostridium aceticum]|uniref:Translation initiation factor IF-3 n=2 Tax=Clostridium aceticum TaxID=84022 RepID=A0A0G3W841_9CLOT|nr:translation initiation factor IF-3 [Clostridium aceticum]AKL94503.1 translation initiation factor IF-3 [Clostridium aceticum]